jgi:hypothetical protein
LFQKDAVPMTWILIKMACYINKRFEKTDVKETRCECKYFAETQPMKWFVIIYIWKVFFSKSRCTLLKKYFHQKQSSRNVPVLSCQTSIGQILLRTDTRLVFCNRKLMRTDIFFTRTTKPICNFANSAKVTTCGWWRITPSNDNYYRSF